MIRLPPRTPTQLSDAIFTQIVSRHTASEVTVLEDHFAQEQPIALVFNGISHAVMMATPVDLEAFAVGFSCSEGIVEHVSDIFDIEIEKHLEGIEVQITIAQACFLNLKAQRRTMTGRTGCGLCGVESLSLFEKENIPNAPVTSPHLELTRNILDRALAMLPDRQPIMKITGGTHAASWCSETGEILQTYEDVGRHNALDKLLGWYALTQSAEKSAPGWVLMTSRAGYELIRKLARLNIATLATLSAPTALALQTAQQFQIQLYSFCRPQTFLSHSLPPPR